MISKEVTILNKQGLHARPATALVNTASTFKSDIFISRDEKKVNGKSILGLLVLAAEHGARLTIEADGPDEEDAVAALAALVTDHFGMGKHS
ncbi:MAG: HPr family phosphocarrier protein [Candidatus Neomarinimicrobiota bacterium]|jgi:phosphocarrier protein|nr:HPr family phosphocarrier protein [Candidatus Neomarinimicrobiota bacterium]MDD3965679.1 HPr family phosphocarrier protein [Candidatus Neomarinimicrobiota bacterium]MDX9781190.1 HPr family phosphocarrier protein [bacterium]